jgi:polysaccharide chain length determinant protein (PEP-CTERM system associated)
METDKGGKRLSAFTVVRMLKRRWLYWLVPMVAITAAVAIYTGRMPKRFRAQALVASVAAAPEPYLSGRVDAAAAANVQENLRAIRETLLSPPVLETVIREFKLYDVAGSRGVERAIGAMKARIQVQVESPDAFYVGFEGDQPQQVMQVANRLAALFVERTSDLHGERLAHVDSLLDAEVNRLRAQVADQEAGLKNYRQSVAQELPDRLATNLKWLENLQQQSQTKSDQIAEAQARRLAVVDEILALENQGALEGDQRQKTANETALDDLRLKLRQLKTRYTAANPDIQRTEKEIRDLEALGTPLGTRAEPSAIHMRYITLQAELASIDQRVKSYQQERSALTSQMANYENRVNSSPGLETTLAQRMRDAALTRTQYETMLAKQQAQQLDQRVEKSDQRVAFKVIEPAEAPAAPYSPQRQRLILMGFLAGLGLGLAGVLLVEQMDTSFETTEEVQGFTNLPVLSAIPTITNRPVRMGAAKNGRHGPIRLEALKLNDDGVTPEARRHFQEHRLTVLGDPQSIASQQYGILRLKVQRWMEQTGGRVLLVTSAAGGEGKSVTALNLAIALSASVEGRVLLVDCDLRRPQVHTRLGINDAPGLSDLLALPDGDAGPFVSKVGNLYVMPGGTESSDPAGMFSSRRTATLLARLKKEYQLIVLDSPPIVPIADSHVLAALADGVIVVIRARKTRRELLQRAIESLGVTNILGVVLNDVEYGDTRYAYAYRYYQRHYTGRG